MLRSTAWMSAARNQRVLILHEHDHAHDALELLLLDSGFEVKSAENPAVGLAFARAWVPAAIILDFEIPSFSVVQMARALRALQSPRTMQIIACAGHTQTSALETAISECCDDVIAMPSGGDALLARLRRAPVFEGISWPFVSGFSNSNREQPCVV
jgi:DNA-binding response OmpR family regulator